MASLPLINDACLTWIEHLDLVALEPAYREQWQQMLSGQQPRAPAATPTQATDLQYKVRVLIAAFRRLGHRAAQLDPLGLHQPERIPELELAFHGLDTTPSSTQLASLDFADGKSITLGELVRQLKNTYCHTIGLEVFDNIHEPSGRWLVHQLETQLNNPEALQPADKKALLQRLTAAEGLERYLGRRYPGAKRFGLDGCESLIPLLESIYSQAATEGVKEICTGMAHRGRLNVLVNIFGKPTSDLFAEFDGHINPGTETGDVKYHQGFSSNARMHCGNQVHWALAFNPSHLEAVTPVVQGSVRARQDRRSLKGGNGHQEVMAVVLHGDAAFSGQGAVMETLQMAATPSYGTGGSIHIIINNQIGYTLRNPQEARSTRYCTDIARMTSAPVIHVNADAPESVLIAAKLATQYRYQFKRDIVIDLVGYRRLGHNESDEPSATEPVMYQKIRSHPSVRQIYTRQLTANQICTEEDAEQMATRYRSALESGQALTAFPVTQTAPAEMFDWSPYLSPQHTAPKTAISAPLIQQLATDLIQVPTSFKLHRQVERLMQNREKMLHKKAGVDWGCAEMLAYASLLHQSYPIRFTGQDSRRGTFSHRHAVLFDQDSGDSFAPLEHIAQRGGTQISLYDSFLSEEAVLAFEYGYSATWPQGLVIWEAQFGDFANGAQVIIDQFIVSAEQKWKRLSGLVLLLPHGHEGQGPEHSSARLERFLQLCARDNIQVCIPSTAAQMFHLLRLQALHSQRRPLVILSPKSLLRLPEATSPLHAFTKGTFKQVLDDERNSRQLNPNNVQRIVVCSGRAYYALKQRQSASANAQDTALIRIEQLYPFPYKSLEATLRKYPQIKQVIWFQEDPSNQGAWHQIKHRLENVLAKLGQTITLTSVSRPAAAAPAVGWHHIHNSQEEQLLNQVFPS
ncbi:MAG: 2-oxoglutarate dehydrogenase E1 component [Gammaproteobacteria bacterium]